MIDFVFNHFYGLFYDLVLLLIGIGVYKTAMAAAGEEDALPGSPRTWLP